MIHDIMAGENIPFFSSNSEPQNNNFLAIQRFFFLQMAPSLSFLAEWQQLRKKKRKPRFFCSKILSIKKTQPHPELHLPSRLVDFVYWHCFFLELGYGKSTARWDPGCLLCAWNESWMKCRHLNPRKWSRNTMQQVVSKSADTNTQKSPS